MRNNTALVMGASGFLGSHVVKALAQEGRKIRIFARPSSDLSAIEHVDYEVVHGDVRDKRAVEEAMEGCRSVFYCVVDTRAWIKDPRPLYETNVGGLENVLDAAMAADVERFIYTSTFMTIGVNDSGIASEQDAFNWPHDAPDYVKVRVEAENLFMRYCAKGLPGVACNVSMTFGCDDNQPTPHGWLLALMARGEFPFYWNARFSCVGIQDAAQAMLLAEKNGRLGHRYIITEKTLTIKEITAIAAQAAGLKKRFYPLPIPLMYTSCWLIEQCAALLGKETKFTLASVKLTRKAKDFDNSKARKELGWKPQPAEKVVAEAARWFVEQEDEEGQLKLSLF